MGHLERSPGTPASSRATPCCLCPGSSWRDTPAPQGAGTSSGPRASPMLAGIHLPLPTPGDLLRQAVPPGLWQGLGRQRTLWVAHPTRVPPAARPKKGLRAGCLEGSASPNGAGDLGLPQGPPLQDAGERGHLGARGNHCATGGTGPILPTLPFPAPGSCVSCASFLCSFPQQVSFCPLSDLGDSVRRKPALGTGPCRGRLSALTHFGLQMSFWFDSLLRAAAHGGQGAVQVLQRQPRRSFGCTCSAFGGCPFPLFLHVFI